MIIAQNFPDYEGIFCIYLRGSKTTMENSFKENIIKTHSNKNGKNIVVVRRERVVKA